MATLTTDEKDGSKRIQFRWNPRQKRRQFI